MLFAEQLAQCNPATTPPYNTITFLPYFNNYWGDGAGNAFTPDTSTTTAGVTTITATFGILVGVTTTTCSRNNSATFNVSHNIVSTSHTGTMQVCFGDGSVHGISQAGASSLDSTTGYTIWYEYCTPGGGEVLPSF